MYLPVSLFVIYVIHYMSQRPDMPPPPNQTSDETEKMMPAESEKLPESGVSSRSNSSLKKDVEEKPLPMSYKPRENEQFLQYVFKTKKSNGTHKFQQKLFLFNILFPHSESLP